MRKQILAELKRELEKLVAEGTIVEMGVTEKNNGVKLQTVTINEPDSKVMPCFHIDRWLEAVEKGKITVRELAEDIVKEAHKENKIDGLPGAISGFSKNMILDNVVYQIINKEMNASRLAEVPHKDFLDLAAVYRVEIALAREEKRTFLVLNRHIEALGITQEELDEAAFKNTEKSGFSVRSMSEVMAELSGMPVEELEMLEIGCPKTYVMTNKDKVNGATIMLYSKFFGELAEKCNDDLLIIPSSIHELFAMPAETMPKEIAEDMVKNVNDTEVEDEEILSYTIYRYRKETGLLEVA